MFAVHETLKNVCVEYTTPFSTEALQSHNSTHPDDENECEPRNDWKFRNMEIKMFYYLTIECDERIAYACNRTRAIPNEHILQQ